MRRDLERVLLTKEEIQSRVAQLRAQLARDYDGKDPVFLGVLKGAVPFFKDLTSEIPIRCSYDFIYASSYGAGVQSSGQVQLLKDASMELRGRHVVVVEDILDTGYTLDFLQKHLLQKKPASLRFCILLDKPEGHKIDFKADYVGFTIPNEFVVGYGLDYNEAYRNLPYVGVLKSEIYSK